ncbi:MAG: Two-component transcriptional response regulator, LuxR family [uncultured Thermomicrobiales bacterium]|uniref:Phosphate regulon transcriptional regulatory protein PhoB n=1 Tax=uncultured Thermomicrobiales bacterium TaxID=1645740 RepID=A0A6J4VT19_9BACT|nr:MAG: Two-component transcriptional response regulator, LuxR family [uncultured Thermomicrobiales bacterium]
MGGRPTVLVVDDEEDIVVLMRDFLEADGYGVLVAHDGAEALAIIASTPPDCVLLDVMMPGQSGFDVVRKVRETSDVPILFLSARQEDSDKIRGLGLGADDYIVKSATPAEIVARVRAVLRRYRRGEAPPAVLLDFGRLVLDLRAREVRVAGRPVPCTAREFDLLQLLAEHPRQVFTREQLFERFWDGYGDSHTLTVHVGRLREKIEEEPARPRYIVTVWGVGYRFEGERR